MVSPFREAVAALEEADDEDDAPVGDEETADGAEPEAAEDRSQAETDSLAPRSGDDQVREHVVDSGGVEWGARWHESAQGWVEDASGQATWRPIVTTAASLSEWEVDTYLGIVVGDAPVSTGAPMDTAMALSRQQAVRLMVDEALARGAHAVIGVALSVNDIGSVPLATATGTAVTLKPGDA